MKRRKANEVERAEERSTERDHALIVFGRQQAELEHYASQKALNLVGLAAWVGKLWVSHTRQWDADRVSDLQSYGFVLEAGNIRSSSSAPESSDGSYDGRSSRTGRTYKKRKNQRKGTSEAEKDQVKTNVFKTNWPKTGIARLEESIRRMKKRSDPMAQRVLKGLLRKRRAMRKAVK